MEKAICPSCLHVNPATTDKCQQCTKKLYLQDRYLIQEIIDQTAHRTIYLAHDKNRCGNADCGAWIENIVETECPSCGISNPPSFTCELYQQTIPPVPIQTSLQTISYWFYEETHKAWFGLAKPHWIADWFVTGQKIEIAVATDQGQKYDHNEDALLVQKTTCYFNGCPSETAVLAVADGIGGHKGGEIASKAAIAGLLIAMPLLVGQQITPISHKTSRKQLRETFKQAVQQANQSVFSQHQVTELDLGATLTAVWLLHGLAIVANVGDSRTYLYRSGDLQQITNDHSKVYRLLMNQQITRDEIYTHPERNIIYRSLGDKEFAEVDIFAIELEPNDLLVLCCDGLWEMVRDEGIHHVLEEEPDLPSACQRLIQNANDAGGEDNITVILTQVQPR